MACLCLLFIGRADTQTIYVKEGGMGTGSSWQDATGNLQLALQQAREGTEIWVARGTYRPTSGSNRFESFAIGDGVKVRGGFAGTETTASQRQLSVNETILSGEIGKPGIADNSYHVVTIGQAGPGTLLEGFTLEGGHANLENQLHPMAAFGGGLLINAQDRTSAPVIRQVTFRHNSARNGAGVYINGRKGRCNPVFESCSFEHNEAGLDGGAVYNDGSKGGRAHPMFNGCIFDRNIATYGGAVCSSSAEGDCSLTMSQCIFRDNAAFLRGGAIFSLNGAEQCLLDLAECQFAGNFPDDRNMIFSNYAGRSKGYGLQQTP
ncbi:MAG: hypothetical protein RLY31_574 [Bacteroidota bacterium]